MIASMNNDSLHDMSEIEKNRVGRSLKYKDAAERYPVQ